MFGLSDPPTTQKSSRPLFYIYKNGLSLARTRICTRTHIYNPPLFSLHCTLFTLGNVNIRNIRQEEPLPAFCRSAPFAHRKRSREKCAQNNILSCIRCKIIYYQCAMLPSLILYGLKHNTFPFGVKDRQHCLNASPVYVAPRATLAFTRRHKSNYSISVILAASRIMRTKRLSNT